MGFLWSRRWVGFFVTVLVLAALAVRLGDWQFSRLDQRRAANTQTRTNVAEAPVPAADLLKVGRGLPTDDEWRRVTATGRWDDRHTVVIRYQSRDEGPGIDVVTPLVTSNGSAYVVDRGWMSVPDTSGRRPRTPAPAGGDVTITGYVRVDGTGGSAKVVNLSARAISSSEVAKAVSYPVYGGFVMMTSQVPRPARALGGPQLPELDDGPHFFYGLQWWFFGLLAVVGFLYLAYDERRQRRVLRAEAAAPGWSLRARTPALTLTLTLSLALASAPTTPRSPATARPGPTTWSTPTEPVTVTGLRIDTDVEMTTRDGVVLRADVYRPDDDRPHPALLHRTPYDKSYPNLVSVLVADPVALARAGYAVVVQDVRGRFASDGVLDFAEQEHDDGYDAVEWAAAQDWCDSQVGIYGSSYHAITTYAALAAAPPHLSAALVMIGTADLATTVRPGGLFELGFLTYYSLGQVVEQIRRSDRPDTDKRALVTRVLRSLGGLSDTVARTPLTDLDVLSEDGLAPWWSTWLGDETGGYVTRSLARERTLPDVPLLSVVGFRDFMAPSMWSVIARRAPSQRHRLVVGPWAHNGTYTGHVGARAYPGAPGGVAAWQPVIQGWFDRWLTDRPDRVGSPAARALLDGPPVAWFSTGSERWSSGPTWPPAQASAVDWFLDDGGVLSRASGSGATSYRHDPGDPVPTVGGAFTAPLLGPDGIQDQAARQARPDVAVWTSQPVLAPVAVTGAPVLHVHLECTGEDTDLVVVLSDVAPDGFVTNVAEGALRARTRLGGTDAWLVPGEVTELAVQLHHTAHVLAVGHRVRVDLAASSFPRFSRNLGTREVPELGRLEDAVVTTQTVHHDTAHPSRLSLSTLA